jgi:hypothetical protein
VKVLDQIEFDIGAPEEVVDRMGPMKAAADGWLTLLPGVEENTAPLQRTGLFALFSGPRFDVPEASWVPSHKPGDPVSIGIRHAHGQRAARQLVERGHHAPDGWRLRMDHPRRGLVIEVPLEADDREVLDWLLSATILLTNVPLLEGWLAEQRTVG